MQVSVFVRSHVERCLADMLGVCRVAADQDGDYYFRSGTAACYVRVDEQNPLMIRTFAIAASGVPRSAKLLTEINAINVHSRSAWVTWAGAQVLVSQVMTPESVTVETLDQACRAVVTIANDIGAMIAAVFGGSTPFAPGQDATQVSGE